MHRIALADGLLALTAGLLALTGLLTAAPGEARRSASNPPPLYGVTWQGSLALGRKAVVGARAAISLIDARTGRELRRFECFAMSLMDGDAPVGY